MQGADGKLQAFGFCEFEVPEATMRCMRLLNEWPIADKKLVVCIVFYLLFPVCNCHYGIGVI